MINTHPDRTSPVATGDLHALARELGNVRGAISRNARMIREEKIYLFGRLKLADAIVEKNLQLSLFSPAQRSNG
jgi:hypothetical protein